MRALLGDVFTSFASNVMLSFQLVLRLRVLNVNNTKTIPAKAVKVVFCFNRPENELTENGFRRLKYFSVRYAIAIANPSDGIYKNLSAMVDSIRNKIFETSEIVPK